MGARPVGPEDDPGSDTYYREDADDIPKHVWLAANEDLHRREKEQADGRRHNWPVDRNGKRRRPTLEQKSTMFQTERRSWWQAQPRTPCEAAWRIPYCVSALKEYAKVGRGELDFPVFMPDGSPTTAVFHCEVRIVAGVQVRVILDPITRTVYTGHGI